MLTSEAPSGITLAESAAPPIGVAEYLRRHT
jgi:hypothetical protein